MKCLSLLSEMATFRSNRKIEKPGLVGCSGIFLLLVANFQFVATSVTWTAPPPAWNQTDPNDIRTVDMPVLNGSTQVALRWSYTLSPGSQLLSTTFSFADGSIDSIGTKSSGVTTVFDRNDYRTRFGISRSEVATLIINKVTEREERIYQCELTTASNTWRYRIRVIATVESSLTSDSGNRTASEGSNVILFCNATGEPAPNVTWTKENGNDGEEVFSGNPLVIVNIGRNDTGTYRCTANNGIGKPVSRSLYVNVTYPAKIVKLEREHEVAAQQSASLDCEAEGNPQPTYTWTPCDPPQSVCNESTLIIPEVLKDGNYSCSVKNSLGSDTTNTSLFIASDVINVTLVITGEECTGGEYSQLWENLNQTINKIFAGKLSYQSVQQKNIRRGSPGVIVELALKFSSTVRESEVLSILRDAANNGTFGNCNVISITGTRYDTEITTTMATTPTSSPDNNKWIILGSVLGAAAVLTGSGVGARHVYKKRRCKKRDTKVRNNGSQEEAGGDVQGEGYVEVNRGYKGGTNRHSGGANPSQVPAVLYDTAQTGNRGAVKEPPVAQYAVVDKSKKKPKKPKPGELQYAELGEFSIGQGGPRSSTSPTSRHTETQYADVNAM